MNYELFVSLASSEQAEAGTKAAPRVGTHTATIMQQILEPFLTAYNWQGVALAGILLVLFGLQLYYYVFSYGRIPSYRNSRRTPIREKEPPVSVIVPMFAEEYTFVEERLPLLLAQNYPAYEVVIVYVGQDNDFYEDLLRLKNSFPQIYTSKILFDPRFPISRKMALNVGIKSAHYDCMIFTSTDACPQSDHWLSLMARGFLRGDIVVGYCGIEQEKGPKNRFMRTWRMMHSASWLARAIARRPYRGTLHNFGFTKAIYFGANGFGQLNMNIGEDDLFMQQVMTRDNVSIILTPQATLREKTWGGLSWWLNRLRYYASARRFYPHAVRNYLQWEVGSRVLFFLSVLCAIAVMPLEYKFAALLLLLLRYVAVVVEVRRIAQRLGESRLLLSYFLYDLFSPCWSFLLSLTLLRKDTRVWR